MTLTRSRYRPQAEDISIEADRLEFDLLRKRTAADRLKMMNSCNRSVRLLSLAGLKARHPNLSYNAFSLRVAHTFLDAPIDGLVPTGTEMTWIQDSIALAVTIHNLLERLEIAYYITGGVASSTYGDPRSTRDLDVVVNLSAAEVSRLVVPLEQAGFYVPGIEDVESGRLRTLNVTQTDTISRADLVLPNQDEFDRIKFQRRRLLEIPGYGSLYFASPEDVVLNKLRWGKQSRSEKQWRDVLGVLKVQGDTLDRAYLDHWSTQLDLSADFDRALGEAGLD